jgi:hypothetical protein
MKKTLAIPLFRVMSAAILLTTLIANQINNLDTGSPFAPHYLFLFTIQGNLLTAMWFLAVALIPRIRLDHSRFRGALMSWGFVLSIVYWIIIAPRMLHPDPFNWKMNIILHSWSPLALLADCLMTGNCKKIGWKEPLVWTAYPVGYLLVTLIRGWVINWYPYPFLDPAWMGSYLTLGGFGAILLLVFLASGFLILLANRLMTKRGESVMVYRQGESFNP